MLRALGLNDELAHSSIRFTLGRFTTEQEIDYTIDLVKSAVKKIKRFIATMGHVQRGIDLNSIGGLTTNLLILLRNRLWHTVIKLLSIMKIHAM